MGGDPVVEGGLGGVGAFSLVVNCLLQYIPTKNKKKTRTQQRQQRQQLTRTPEPPGTDEGPIGRWDVSTTIPRER